MGFDVLASPKIGNTRIITFGLLNLSSNNTDVYSFNSLNEEIIINILSGKCSIEISGEGFNQVKYKNVGGREDIFSGKPEMVYVPPESEVKIKKECINLSCGIAKAVGDVNYKPGIVRENEVKVITSGKGDWERRVYLGIDDKFPANSLMMGETDNPPGNWSGYPPHKHDTSSFPGEADMEEAYFMQFKPPNGFAVGGKYFRKGDSKQVTSDIEFIQHNQVFGVPTGYHFIAPAPGFHLKYIFIFGGERDLGAWKVDPKLSDLE